MKTLSLVALVGLAVAQSTTTSSSAEAAAASSSTSASPDYTITALPAVISQAPCVFNCLIPIGLADPSGCDDVSEACACLSAPADVLDVLTACVETVCQSSTSAFAASATSLYESYCNSVFGAAVFSSAFVAESAAAASSSIASVEASSTSASTSSQAASSKTSGASASVGGATSSSFSASASATGSEKSGSISWYPSLLTAGLVAIGGLVFPLLL